MECNLLKNIYANLFNFVDNATHVNGNFIVIFNSNSYIEILGLPLHRNLRYSDICISEPFCQKVKYRGNHLPPISMDFFLPSSYPGDRHFFFTLHCSWLPEDLMERLRVIVNKQINEFSYEMALEHCCQFLHEKTLLELLKLGAFPLDIAKEFQDGQYNPYLITEMLINYEEEQRDIEFLSKMYECSVCINELSGKDCIRLRGCGHVICRNCAGNQVAVQVRDSARGGAPTCPECDETVRQQDIRDVVSDEIYTDYERRLLNKTLSSMPDIIACPNKDCVVEHVSLVEDLSQGTCPQCLFHFCARCKAAFHEDSACQTGPLVELQPAEIAELLDRYSAAGTDGKQTLEMEYGKANLDKLKGEHLSYTLISEECKMCPNCSSPINKIGGCNKMKCESCQKNFCWLCLQVLDDDEPYSHFGKDCELEFMT